MDSSVQSNEDPRFGKYTLIAKLATGGMGEIFLAKLSGMAGFEKLVVIKRLLPHLAEDQHFVTMLLDEARIAARLSHPNVCQVYDLGEVNGVFYIAMEFLEGVPCSEMLKVARRDDTLIGVPMAANILEQTCAGLHHAHSLKDSKGNEISLVHRDVSPSNLFATVSGSIKVLDFGVAKSQDARARTHTGALKGKYAYMSPEQVMAEDLDRRSDVFSLGIVLFELLTTRRLFWRDSEYKMFQAIAEDPIPDVRDFRPDAPAEIAAVVTKALSRDVATRFQTAEEMGQAITAAMAGHGGMAPNAEIASYVQATFDEQIRERRQLVVTAVSPHAQPTVADGRADMGEHSREVSPREAAELFTEDTPDVLHDVLGDLAEERAKEERSRGVLFWGALVAFGVLAAVGASFLLGVMKKDEPKTPGAIVINEVAPEAIDASAEAALDGSAATLASADSGPDTGKNGGTAASGDGSGSAGTDKGSGSDKPPPPVVTVTPSREYFAKTFSAKQGRNIRGCLSANPGDTGDRKKLNLIMKVEKDGRVSSAEITPSAIARSGLGKCLLRAARRTKFDALESRSRVSLPISLKRN